MGLLKKKKSDIYDNEIACRIRQRRYQLLVHALLYYDLGITIVPDYKWDKWANELVELQANNTEVAGKVEFSQEFGEFNPSTGYDLEYRQSRIIAIAYNLLRDRGIGEELTRFNSNFIVERKK